MPQRRYYGDRGGRPEDIASMYELGRRIREQITGEEERRKAMDREFEGIELEEAQLLLRELQGKKKHQELKDQLAALEMNRQGEIAAIAAREGTPAPTLSDMLGGQRQAQLQGAGGGPDIPMNLPIPEVQLQHPTQQVRGIQIPEAGIDVPGYSQRPQSMQEMLELLTQQELAKSMVPIPEELRQPGQIFPGSPELPAELHKTVLTGLLNRMITQQGAAERQAGKFGQQTTEREAGQEFKAGEAQKTRGFKGTQTEETQEFKAGEAEKKRKSTEEQKQLDRESRERIRRMGVGGTGDTLLDKVNKERLMFGAAPLDKLPELGQEPVTEQVAEEAPAPEKAGFFSEILSRLLGGTAKPPEVGEAKAGPEVHIETPNGRNLTATMVQRYLDAAGGDRELARKLAREDGWKFETEAEGK